MSTPLFVYDVLLLVVVTLSVQSFWLAYRERNEPELLWCGAFFLLCAADHLGLMATECGVVLTSPLAARLAAVLAELVYEGFAVTSRKVAEHLFSLPVHPAEWVFFAVGTLLVVSGALGGQGLVISLAAPVTFLYLAAGSAFLGIRTLRRRSDYPTNFFLLLTLLLVVTILMWVSLLLPASWRLFPLSSIRNLTDELLTIAYLGLSGWYFWSTASRAEERPRPLDLVALGRDHGLSEREIEVMQLIAADKTYLQIGSELWIGESTVKTHARRIYQKLGVKNRVEFRAMLKEANVRTAVPGHAKRAAALGLGGQGSAAPST